jgi:hypothetical protein
METGRGGTGWLEQEQASCRVTGHGVALNAAGIEAVGDAREQAGQFAQTIGTCFHIGDGVFITARHVVEGNTIAKVATTFTGTTTLGGGYGGSYIAGAWQMASCGAGAAAEPGAVGKKSPVCGEVWPFGG